MPTANLRRVLRAVAVVIVLGWTVLGAAQATGAEPSVACGFAQELTNDGFPERALQLIAQAQATSATDPRCAAAQVAALNAVTSAASTATEAELALDGRDWSGALHLATKALALNAQNQLATQVKASAEAQQPVKTRAEKVGTAWSSFWDRYVVPLGAVVLAWLGVVLALVVVARLLTTIKVKWKPHRSSARILTWGLVLVGLGAAAGTLGLSGGTVGIGLARSPALDVPILIVAIGLSAAGVCLTTTGLATRLRLHVEVRDADGKVSEGSTSQVIALLSEMGADKPKGIEAPRGIDVETLSGGVISAVAGNKLTKSLSTLAQLVLGVIPWRVIVDQENANSQSIVITRNGRTAATAVVDRKSLGLTASALEAAPPDLHVMAAALTLVTLASEYPDRFEGLCGATRWKSLGLYYLATNELLDKQDAAPLLAAAVQEDPSNKLAQVAYQHELFRTSTDPAELRSYSTWLVKALNVLHSPGTQQLRRRVLYSRLVALINLYYAEHRTGAVPHETVSAANQLIDWLVRNADSSPPAKASEPAIAGMARWVYERAPHELTDDERRALEWAEARYGLVEEGQLAINGHYNMACYDVTCLNYAHMTAEQQQAARASAVGHLRLVQRHPLYGKLMKDDPQLGELVRSQEYRLEFGAEPEKDFLTLQPLLPFADRLRKVGIVGCHDLARYVDHPELLQGYLPIDQEAAGRLAQLGLVGSSSHNGLEKYAVEICAELLDMHQLERLLTDPSTLWPSIFYAVRIKQGIAKRCKDAPSEVALLRWLLRWSLRAGRDRLTHPGDGARLART